MASTLTTGSKGTGNPVPRAQSPVYRVIQYFSGMSATGKRLLAGGIAAALACAIIVSVQSAKNTRVALFEGRKITAFEAQQMCLELERLGVDVEMDGSGVNLMVLPSDKAKARMRLAVAGYPKAPVVPEREPENSLLKTDREREALLFRRLQGDLSLAIQSLEGVRSAVVQLSIPEKRFFEEEKERTKAAVMVMAQPGHSFTPDQVRGIIHLISSSVAGLETREVQVLDERGRLLSDMVSGGEDTPLSGGPDLSRTFQGRKQDAEKYLEEKLQTVLDKTLGPEKAVASVSVELDFSQVRTESRSYHGPANSKGAVTEARQIEKESYMREGEGLAKGSGTWMGDASRMDCFSRESRREKIKVGETTVTRTRPPGEIKRLAVAVLVDGLSDDIVSSIQSIAKNVVGVDEGRGDSITVRSIPFGVDVFAVMKKNLWEKVENPPADPQALLTAAWRLLAILAALALVAAGFFLYNERKGQRQKRGMFLGTVAYGPMQEISDLLSERTVGARTPERPDPQASTLRLRVSEDLELLARQKPTRVAELLKTRYLADMK